MEDFKSNQRRPEGKANPSVDEEVARLLRKGEKVDASEFLRLRTKYGDQEMVDRIQQAYLEKHRKINKKARAFAMKVREKMGSTDVPFSALLMKARKYQKKYELSDEEFAEFQRIYEAELAGKDTSVKVTPMTNMAKVLGTITVDSQNYPLRATPNDAAFLDEILRQYEETRPLHSQVVLQSMTYQDCAFEAVTGKFNRDLHNAASYIHPVLVAMFLPKFEKVEEHFLFANIAGIVKARNAGESFTSRPDYELFYHITKDPNDIVCDSRSPIRDLLHRARLQKALWAAVRDLRSGQYFNPSNLEFLRAVDMCRMNRYDSPELVYGRYDGTILKRLLAAFSFRPTVVSTSPLFPISSGNMFVQAPSVTRVSMINYRLPPPTAAGASAPIQIRDMLRQNQYYYENGMLVPKTQSYIYSQGVLMLYVDRRLHWLQTIQVNPVPMDNLPSAISGFERLNPREVEVALSLELPAGDSYVLRSVVQAEVNTFTTGAGVSSQNLVVGSSTLVRMVSESGDRDTVLLYNPLDINRADVTTTPYVIRNDVIYTVPLTPAFGDDENALTVTASKRGIVFMYQLVRDSSKGVVAL